MTALIQEARAALAAAGYPCPGLMPGAGWQVVHGDGERWAAAAEAEIDGHHALLAVGRDWREDGVRPAASFRWCSVDHGRVPGALADRLRTALREALDGLDASDARCQDAPEGTRSGRGPKGAPCFELAPLAPLAPLIESVSFDRVQELELRWLWRDRVPLGKLTVVAGDPGLGKTLLWLATAPAHVTTGRAWPDGAPCEVGEVALLSCEDDASDTLKPRLLAAEADCARVHLLGEVVAEDGRKKYLSLADAQAVERWLCDHPAVRLLVLDPLGALFGGRDSHTDAEVRELLRPWKDVAQRTGVAVVFIAHLNKRAGGSPQSRIMGSIGVTAAARAVWLMAKDPEDEARRLLLPAKHNLCPDQGGLAYRIQTGLNGAPVVVWEAGSVALTASEALAPPIDDEEKGALSDAKAFLLDLLKFGGCDAKDALAQARPAGVSERTLKRAKAALGVRATKGLYGWRWNLPAHSQEGQEGQEGQACHGGGAWPSSPDHAQSAPPRASEWIPE